MSRSVLHFALSLVLLVSQQMAFAHGWTHWDAARQGALSQHAGQPQATDGQDAPALLEFCLECAADAQLDLALPAPDHALRMPESVAAAVAIYHADSVLPQPIRPFQPRAPPRLN